ncbi:MAG: hypothetical protein LBQ10_07285 [Desulfovibrio sp.]|nr:hypothetical protein [Desulfovibrio sp.]
MDAGKKSANNHAEISAQIAELLLDKTPTEAASIVCAALNSVFALKKGVISRIVYYDISEYKCAE